MSFPTYPMMAGTMAAFVSGCAMSSRLVTPTKDASLPSSIEGDDADDDPSMHFVSVEKDPEVELAGLTYVQREHFTMVARKHVERFDRELGRLRTFVEDTEEPRRTELRPKLQVLRLHVIRLHEQLDLLQDAELSAWYHGRSVFLLGCRELAHGILGSSSWFETKVVR